MKICYLGNAQNVHLRRWVNYFVQHGHEVHVVTRQPAEIKGAFVHDISSSTTSVFQRIPIAARLFHLLHERVKLKRLRRLIEKIDPSILHAHYLTDYGILGAHIGFHPFIITPWGSDILITPKEFGEKHVSLMKYALGRADLITCDAHHMKEAIRRLGIAPEKITLIYFGVDTRKFSPGEKSEELREKLGIYNSPTVISLRNLEPIYDIESLIRSLPLVLSTHTEVPESKFVIAGKGSEEKRLRELAKSLGVSDSVKFVGFVQGEKLPEYLKSADVYVSTSLSDAGIAASTAEAMACELPVIVTNVADNKKWVDNGVNGFVVPVKNPKSLAEKITYLLQNEDIRKKFGKLNRKIIEERNDYYKEMSKMENIYRKLAERYRR